ncbi:unnamed protein product [Pieris macdunnoughi]|uniref:Uncharacterized protein n=1 Tax=Pieris macdunnoughi TaxID=345717 RepID=A0A821WA58_9NEOP|nr:unnamed protein product [Pieris macdunnoughi]
MSLFSVFILCLQACLIQNAFAWIAEPALAPCLANQAWGPAGPAMGFAPAPGLANPAWGLAGPAMGIAPGPFAPAPFEAGIAPYGGEGIGDVAVAGEMPVAGTTMVAGQVPILGAVRFAGDLPAGGVVSIAGSSGCGRSPYMY